MNFCHGVRVLLFACVVVWTGPAGAGGIRMPGRGVCAHRGAMTTHPENTLPAFAEAIRLGAHMIEFDVQPTSDGVMVLMHDATVDRTTDGKGKVSELPFETIRALDAGIRKDPRFAGTRVPTFEEALAVMPRNVWLNCHLKGGAATGATAAQAIARAGRLHQAFLAATSEAARGARAAVPGILICNMERQGGSLEYAKATIAMKADFIQILGKGEIPDDIVKMLRAAGVRINYFQDETPEGLRRQWKAGIDFPLANDVAAALAVAAESGIPPWRGEPVYTERLRPQFHFTARRGRLNDPNGLLHYDGEYHLFYQLHPYSSKSGSKHWGHAVSRDLVRWQELPIALYPGAEGMMFSGSGVVDWKNTTGFGRGGEPPLVLIFTATGPPRTQGLAYSNDRGRTWTKYEGNPVLPEVEFNNRDPRVFWHEPTRRWVMALHCTPRGRKFPDAPEGSKDRSGTIGIFTSPDLKQWTSAGRIDGFRECPDLFPMKVDGTGETKWILHGGSGDYRVGDFDGATFRPTSGFLHGPHGGAFYAGQTFSDMPGGRVVQLGWARMSDAVFEDMPFSQMMNIPCDLNLVPTADGPVLSWRPVREIETLYAKRHDVAAGSLGAGSSPLKDVRTEFFDLRADLDVGTAAGIVLNLRGTEFVLDVARQRLVCGKASMPLPVVGGRARFRLLSDRGLAEVFAGDGTAFGAFALAPKAGAPLAPELAARGGEARIVSLTVDELASAWPEPAGP